MHSSYRVNHISSVFCSNELVAQIYRYTVERLIFNFAIFVLNLKDATDKNDSTTITHSFFINFRCYQQSK